MENALETIRHLRQRQEKAVLWDHGLEFNQQLVAFLELGNMLLLAEAVAHAALAREETRGVHVRTDFPERDDKKWLRHSLQYYSPDGPSLSHTPVKLGDFTLKESVIIR